MTSIEERPRRYGEVEAAMVPTWKSERYDVRESCLKRVGPTLFYSKSAGPSLVTLREGTGRTH